MPVFSFTAPHITPEEEERERSTLSEEMKMELHDDLYGHRHDLELLETDQLVGGKLAEFERELSQIPAPLLKDYKEAMERAPELVQTESNPLKFLRCEKYDAAKAARRMSMYWKTRRKCFGDDRAFLPMKLHGAMKDDICVVESAIVSILPNDMNGRGVLFFDRIRAIPPMADRDAVLRCIFFMIHIMSEDMDIQKSGYVCLNNIKGYDLYKHFDRIFIKQSSILMVESMPTKIKAYHLLAGSENGVMSLVLPVMKHVVAQELRLRMVVHSGNDRKIMDTLRPYGLTSANLSFVLGGDFKQSDFMNWLHNWKKAEEPDNADLSCSFMMTGK